MALSDVTVTFDLAQLLGSDFDSRRTRAYVTTNVENQTLMDTSTGETRIGDERVTIADDGTGSFTTWAPGPDGNPTSWQTTLVVEYPRAGSRDRQVRRFGPYTITASGTLAGLEEEQAVPAEYLTQVTDTLQTYVDQGLQYRNQQAQIALGDAEEVVATVVDRRAGVTIGASTDDGLGGIIVDFDSRWYISDATGDPYESTLGPLDPADEPAILAADQTGAVFVVVPGTSATSTLDRVIALEEMVKPDALSSPAAAWTASTAVEQYALTVLPTGGLGYCTTDRTTRSSWDATERDEWVFIPGGHYEATTAAGTSSWKCPDGITTVTVGVTGGGGGGAGGGRGHATAQVGGGGGGAGAFARFAVSGLVTGSSYSYTVGSGGAAGAGATVDGAGTNGGNGTVTTFTGPGGTVYSGAGGGGGPSASNAVSSIGAGAYGLAVTMTTTYVPGIGGTASASAGNGASPNGPTIGGGGGGPANATLGGNGGAARIAPGGGVGTINTKTASTSGGAGAAPTIPGCGGAGGGGAAPGGTGGAGAAGAPGAIEFWF